jgi:MOSC domain-containing protein YiiM
MIPRKLRLVLAFVLSTTTSTSSTVVAGFTTNTECRSFTSRCNKQQLTTYTTTSLSSSSWKDDIQDLFSGGKLKNSFKTAVSSSSFAKKNDDLNGTGVVVRLAARAYNATTSKPSSRGYTTRKMAFPQVSVTSEGIKGDYNHYRTVALKSTKDRAVSILTTDVMMSLRATYPSYQFNDGDLGENIYVDDVTFGFFQVGMQYKFESPAADKKDNDGREDDYVVIQITEPIEPCANLCKLSYINDDSISASDRIKRCQDFIIHLDRYDGYRGWYARVIQEGVISNAARVRAVR